MKIAIVGAGKLGSKLVAALSGSNHSIIVIDDRNDVLDKVSAFYDVMTLPGNGKQLSFLKENGIGTCDYLIACTDSDEANMVISTLAKSIGCKKVIARVRNPEYMNHMDSIKECFNIDYTVNPDLAITNEIYKYLVEKYTLTNGIFRSGRLFGLIMEYSSSFSQGKYRAAAICERGTLIGGNNAVARLLSVFGYD